MKSQCVKLTSLFLLIFLVLVPPMKVFASPAIPTGLQQQDISTAIEQGFAYIATQITPDGGIPWTDETGSPAATIRVVLALASAGYPQGYLQSTTGKTPIDFLESQGLSWIRPVDDENKSRFNVGRAGQLLAAIAAANGNPRSFGTADEDLIQAVMSHYDANTGIFGESTPENVTDQVWAIIGLAANYATVPEEAVNSLKSAQLEDGSWNDGWDGYLDMTPLAVIALAASGHISLLAPEIQAAVDFMMTGQQADGGWQTEWDTSTNPDTTGMMLQAIHILDQLPMDDNWQKTEGNPLTALLTVQQENGSFGGEYANAFSTADAILGLSGQPFTQTGHVVRTNRAYAYLISTQGADGGWESPGQTLDVILALTAAGWDPTSVVSKDQSPIQYLENNLNAYLDNGPDAMGKSILGLVAAGQDPRNFNDLNLVQMLLESYDSSAGVFGAEDNTWHQALAILGLKSAGETIPEGAVDQLLNLQEVNGGWEYAKGTGEWPDNTALAIQALIAAGLPSDHQAIQKALDFLATTQLETGGWGDASTTAYVLMGLTSLDLDPSSWIMDSEKGPLQALLSYQKDSGAFVYAWDYPEDNLMATTAALMALLKQDLILAPPMEQKMAGLVIDPGDEAPQTVCVSMTDESVSGLQLLTDSGIEYDQEEGFIHSIMGVENPDGGTYYWSYWHWNGREWLSYQVGAGASEIVNGTINGWHFVNWEEIPSPPPNVIPHLAELCGGPTLVSYQAQPFLSFEDLQTRAIPVPSEHAETEAESTPTPSAVEETAEADEPIEPTRQSPIEKTETVSAETTVTRSILPLLLIAGLAIILIMIVIIILRKKDQ
jgi:hypothetical protein